MRWKSSCSRHLLHDSSPRYPTGLPTGLTSRSSLRPSDRCLRLRCGLAIAIASISSLPCSPPPPTSILLTSLPPSVALSLPFAASSSSSREASIVDTASSPRDTWLHSSRCLVAAASLPSPWTEEWSGDLAFAVPTDEARRTTRPASWLPEVGRAKGRRSTVRASTEGACHMRFIGSSSTLRPSKIPPWN